MKRMIVLAGLTGALFTCAVALGSTGTYTGSDKDPKCASGGTACDVELHVNKKNGKVTKVQYVVFKQVPASCGGQRDIINNYEPLSVDAHVNRKRKFHGTFKFNLGDATAYITGRFKKNFKAAHGTLRATGAGAMGNPDCDTGIDHYSVHK